jgi:NAD(P)-dependent dehydrogenase (short-subunit alcohol dehydrogenase family)
MINKLKKKVPAERIDYVLGSLEQEKTLKELVSKTVQKFKGIDILVNAAGIAAKPNTPFDSMENFQFVMDVNCKAPVQLALLCIPHLEKSRGVIVNISSIASLIPVSFLNMCIRVKQ